MGNIERGQTDWQPRSLLRKLSATDPSGASDRLIAQQDEIRALRQQLEGAVEALLEAVALLDALVDPDDLPLDVGDRLDSVRRASRRLGGQ